MAEKDPDDLLMPGEVAAMFRVHPKTVERWHKSGKLTRIMTPGGHGRYRRVEVEALLRGEAPRG